MDKNRFPLGGPYYPPIDKIPYSVANLFPGKVLAKATGEFRPPCKGEWYISGAIPAAYKAFENMTNSYHIAKLVRVEVIQSYQEIGDYY